MPDWLRTAVWIVGVLALLLTLVVGYLMWRYRIPPRGLVAMGGAALYLISPIDLRSATASTMSWRLPNAV